MPLRETGIQHAFHTCVLAFELGNLSNIGHIALAMLPLPAVQDLLHDAEFARDVRSIHSHVHPYECLDDLLLRETTLPRDGFQQLLIATVRSKTRACFRGSVQLLNRHRVRPPLDGEVRGKPCAEL
jgi:hypothetical protein